MKKYPPSPKKATAQTVASNNIIAYGIFRFHEGMSICRFHELSHTFASLANSARIPLVDIGKALGHKDVSITGRIYTHIFDQTHQEVLNTVAARIAAG